MPYLNPPANVDDFSKGTDPEDLRQKYHAQVTSYVTQAMDPNADTRGSANFFSPPLDLPANRALPVPWQGFPKSIDRWFDVEANPTDITRKQDAEATADILCPQAYVVAVSGGNHSLIQINANTVKDYPPGSVPAQAKPLRTKSGKTVLMQLRQQDEYLEWRAAKDANGHITKIEFTAEPHDYWEFLASRAPDLVVTLYTQWVDQNVRKEHLFFQEDILAWSVDLDNGGQGSWTLLYPKNSYNPYNRWNTTDGIMHLTHPANSLGAEIILAGGGAGFYASDDAAPGPEFDNDEATARIACAGYGEINRSSDPTIGNAVGDQVKAGNRVTLVNPIGLYIATIDISSLRAPDGSAIASALTINRGDQSDPNAPRILRATVALPDGATYSLDQCKFENRPLQRGGQIARAIGMQLYAAVEAGAIDRTRAPCIASQTVCKHPQHKSFFGHWGSDFVANCAAATAAAWDIVAPVLAQQPAPHLAEFFPPDSPHLAVDAPVNGAMDRQPTAAGRIRPS